MLYNDTTSNLSNQPSQTFHEPLLFKANRQPWNNSWVPDKIKIIYLLNTLWSRPENRTHSSWWGILGVEDSSTGAPWRSSNDLQITAGILTFVKARHRVFNKNRTCYNNPDRNSTGNACRCTLQQTENIGIQLIFFFIYLCLSLSSNVQWSIRMKLLPLRELWLNTWKWMGYSYDYGVFRFYPD